ncbi:hypothetical protein [Massilia sp. erpn]|uniref:hypothetical protein n=1 Tax=Massilia sp. erpn TaxID=2738142 RepID=UPI00210648E7|nr:hypothetical protein [Massilia sp. erpn]UTY60050.1 hypothetical protein HPQ68_24395 [Massilia sp. erpn]
MKTLILAASLLAAVSAAPAASAADVGVSINIGQPGFYGRIDIGSMPPPPVLYAQPVIIQRPVRVISEPLYLRVPPGHAKHWSKHCGRYNACGRQVYFVRDDWYLNDYAPRYRGEHRHEYREERHYGHEHGQGQGQGQGHGHGHGKGHDKHHDKHEDKHDRGHGKHRD